MKKILIGLLVLLLILISGCEETFLGITEREAENQINKNIQGMYDLVDDTVEELGELEKHQSERAKEICIEKKACDKEGGIKYGTIQGDLYCKCNEGELHTYPRIK